MPTINQQRRLLMEGLSQASGTVLWGKLRHIAPQDDLTVETEVAEGSPSRKGRV